MSHRTCAMPTTMCTMRCAIQTCRCWRTGVVMAVPVVVAVAAVEPAEVLVATLVLAAVASAVASALEMATWVGARRVEVVHSS